jgi:hypothetical protein
LDNTVSPEYCFLFQDVDGSGKIRRENHEIIRDTTRKILQQFQPQDINIVISSASGGSGSVLSVSLVAELLEQDKQVIVILVGATDSSLEIENTLKTIKSYESISKLKEKPVVASYYQNSKDSPRDKVDNSIVAMVASLSTVFSRENKELDTQDLYNFINFQRVTSFKPKLVGLSVHIGPINLESEYTTNVCSVACVTTQGSDTTLDFTPEYKTVGYLRENVVAEISSATPINLLTHYDSFTGVAKELQTRLDEYEKIKNARVETKSILTANDKPTSDGLIL